MFTILNKEEMIEKIDKGLKNELEDLVLVFPTIREKIIENLLWGIFSKNKPFKTEEKTKGYYESFALVSYDIIEIAKQKLKTVGEENPQFFAPLVDSHFKENDFIVSINYEDCEIKIDKISKVAKSISEDYRAIIASTLPDSSVVFDPLIKGNIYDEANRWSLEYLDKYDSWKHEVMNHLYDYLWQIGGHGRWIQSDYNETYLAQVNIEIGDAGSVYVEYSNDKITGGIDMF